MPGIQSLRFTYCIQCKAGDSPRTIISFQQDQSYSLLPTSMRRPSWYDRRRKLSYEHRFYPSFYVARRLSKRSILILCLIAVFIAVFSLHGQITDERTQWPSWAGFFDYDLPRQAGPLKVADLPPLTEYSPRRYLKGPPTKLFQGRSCHQVGAFSRLNLLPDNLLDEYHYLTGWIGYVLQPLAFLVLIHLPRQRRMDQRLDVSVPLPLFGILGT